MKERLALLLCGRYVFDESFAEALVLLRKNPLNVITTETPDIFGFAHVAIEPPIHDEEDCRYLLRVARTRPLGGRAKPANEGRVKTGQRGMHSGH